MDATTEILGAMRLSGGVFLDAEFTAPWCLLSQIEPQDCAGFSPLPRSVIALHFVRSGALMLQVAGEEPLAVKAGEIVALPRNDAHVIGSRLDLPPVGAHSLIRPGSDGRLARIRLGGGGEATSVFCGFLGSDRKDDPIIRLLPRIMTLKAEGDASAAWIESSFRFAAQESAAGESASASVLARLAEVLFIDAVRRYLGARQVGIGDLHAVLLDPRIAEALSLLHGQLRRRWTTEELAREVGQSRSAFAERFTRAMGETPMRYLARLRLRRASQHLGGSKDSLARIAFESGYESESAFSRAFKREFGAPPATWRKDPSLRNG